jgi:putative transposase
MNSPVKVEEEFTLRGVDHRVLRITQGRVLVENLATTETRDVDADELLELYRLGDLVITSSASRGAVQLGQARSAPTVDMERLGQKGRDATLLRARWMLALDRRKAFESRHRLKSTIPVVAQELKIAKPPSVPTLYRWLSVWARSHKDPRSLMARFDRRGGRNRYRMSPEVEAIVARHADDIYLGQRRATATSVFNAVELSIEAENRSRLPSEQLQMPSLRTIQARMARLYAFDVSLARNGARKAKKDYGDSVAARPTERILEVAEIDHTPIDLWVVDDDGKLAGRPMLTLLLDRYSRCVLGFFLSLTGHGVDAVFGALRHALLPKTYLAKRYPEVRGNWPCHGRFTTLLADNGSEFAGGSMQAAALDLGINLEFCGSMMPNHKPHVERFFYTFNHRFIHTLKGTSLARVSAREGEQLQNDACLTLAELERLIHVWIVNVYHARPHSGLDGRTPADVWAESAQRFPPDLSLSVAQIDLALSEVAESALGKGGITINNNRYASERLCALRRMLPAGSRVKVRYSRRDVGSILVLDEFSQEYFKVANVKPERAGLSIEQDTAVRKARREAGSHDSLAVAGGEALIRERSNELHATRKIKDHQKASRLQQINSDQVRRPPKSGPKPSAQMQFAEGLFDKAPVKVSAATRNRRA